LAFTFGPFELDPEARRLTRDGEPVALPERHLDILAHMVAHAGTVISKDALVEVGWRDVAVTDNSLEQAVSALRRTLAGDGSDSRTFIQTVPRQGYRFVAEVVRKTRRESDAALDALLAPHRAWLDGQSALETLERARVAEAQQAFERAMRLSPDYPPSHIGLANALVFRFECTRSDATPDTSSLKQAVHHAREACRLAPSLAETWATLGFVLNRAGLTKDAIAAARRGVALEPVNWRHQLRLAFVAWGEERLRAANRTLHLMPGLGLAHFLAATVHVARQAFAAAERDLEAGAAAQDEQRTGRSRFSAVGLHWLRGLVQLREGREDEARDSFARELAFESAGHLYTAECCAHVHYALGALDLRDGRRDAAAAAFERALNLAGGQLLPLAARAAILTGAEGESLREAARSRIESAHRHGFTIDAAIASSVDAVLRGDHVGAAATVRDGLIAGADGSSGWLLPVDPLLRTWENAAWSGVVGEVRKRAA
jgi:DNA-binding winged helix-turn-helix (wHTH) protein